ncbi:MAG: tetratricopeptide repeat protein [Acidobacteriota bacterium]|nr:tetratricopeptide repeat protein [Acidobacteriota bacterium]
MRRAPCRTCKTSLPLAKMYALDGVTVCEPCATRRAQDAQAGGRALKIERAVDPTICSECGADKGETEWLKVAGAPLCFKCRQRFYEVPFPAWVQFGLLAIVALAAFALWHGSAYVEAAQALLAGERLLEQQQYASAATELRTVLEAGSESDRIFLLTVKAYLLAGDYERARLLLNGHPKYEARDALFREVTQIWERAVAANDLAAEAARLAREGKLGAAARKMREAATLYPEMPALDAAAKTLAAQAADQSANQSANQAGVPPAPKGKRPKQTSKQRPKG